MKRLILTISQRKIYIGPIALVSEIHGVNIKKNLLCYLLSPEAFEILI